MRGLPPAREVKQGVDELVQPQRVAVDEPQLPLLGLALGLPQHILERPEHERQRRAELVRDI